MDDELTVIVIGNITEGFEIIGPFADFDAADEFASNHFVMTDVWLMKAWSPEDFLEQEKKKRRYT